MGIGGIEGPWEQLGRWAYLLEKVLFGLGMVLLGRRLCFVTLSLNLRKEWWEIEGVFQWDSEREIYRPYEAEDLDSWDQLGIYQIAWRELA